MDSTRLRALALGLLVPTAVVFAATAARAGFTPWNDPVCADPVTVSGQFAIEYGGIEKCEPMCKLAASHCRFAVKHAASCRKADSSAYWKENTLVFCTGLTGSEKRECVQNFKAAVAGNKATIAANRAAGLANCDSYRAVCLLDCVAPE